MIENIYEIEINKTGDLRMRLENYEMHLPSYSIGDKSYSKIVNVCSDYGRTVLMIGGKKALQAAEDKIRRAIEGSSLEVIGVEIYGHDCTYAAVELLRNLDVYQKADMVFAVGGGKAVDTCKCLCIDDDKPVFSFPTIASNCAATTSVSIMYNEDGTFLKPHFFVRPVMHAFIDTEIIAHAPVQYMWAGIGDPVIEKKHFHGEVVGFGVLFALLCDGQKEEFEKIFEFNRSIGLPVSIEQIDISEEEFKETITRVPSMSDVKHYPYEITEKMLYDAWEVLEERNRFCTGKSV